MFGLYYDGILWRKFRSKGSAFRFLIARGWEWDDKAVIIPLPS